MGISSLKRLSVCITLLVLTPLHAYATSPDLIHTRPIFSGQTHTYDILLRKHGEALVVGSITIPNDEDEYRTEVSYHLGALIPRRLQAFQYVSIPECYSRTTHKLIEFQYCSEGNPETYIRYRSGYRELDPEIEGGTLTLQLAEHIAPKQRAHILLTYRGFGYVKKEWFGRRVFAVSNLESSEDIRNLTLRVGVQKDLFFKNKKSSTIFREELFTQYLAKSNTLEAADIGGTRMAMERDEAFRGQSFLLQGFDYVTESSQFLAPDEFLVARGVYASHFLALHLWKIVIGIIALLLLLSGRYIVRSCPCFQRQRSPQ